MMHRLRPSILDNLGLTEAIKEEVDSFKNRNPNIHCECICAANLNNLNERTSINLYRIMQECLTNISKHAAASRVTIELSGTDKIISLKVSDNGSGFDVDIPARGLGLIGMRERVTSVGGELLLQTAADKGLTISITVPLHATS